MKFTTKTGRKVLGTLIAAAVMVSMIPAMVFAADAEQTPWADIASGITISSKTTITFTAPATGEYTFTTSDRSSYFFIPSYTVDGHSSSLQSPYSVSLTLNKGATYTIVADKASYSYSDWGSYKLSGSCSAYPTFEGSATVTLSRSPWQDFPTSYYVYTAPESGIFTLTVGQVTGINPTVTFDGKSLGDGPFNVEAGKEYLIAATAPRGQSSSGTNYSFTITGSLSIPVTSVEMTDMYFADGDPAAPMSVSLLPGNTTYTVADLTWTPNVEGVATVAVSDGKVMVTPVGVGSTTISASYGEQALGSATVTVYNPDEPVVTVNPSSLDLGLDSDPVTLSYTLIAPEDHEIEFVGFFVDEADEGVIEVDMETGMVTPIGVGTATVYAGIWDYTLDDWFEGTCTVTVSEVAPDPEVPFYTEEQLRAMSVQNFVEGLYLTILNRQYDAAGRDSWMNSIMQQNGTATSVVIGFLESPEFTSKNLSNEEFVATCYRVFCNRAATAAETAQWVAQLEGGATRDSVIRQFAQSPEWANICAFFRVNV